MFLALVVQVALGLIAEDEDGIYTGPLYRLVSTDTSDKARDLHDILHVGGANDDAGIVKTGN